MLRVVLISLGALCMLGAILASVATLLLRDQTSARIGGLLWIAGPILIFCGRRLKPLH